MEAFDQGPRVGIGFGIEALIADGRCGEETPQPQHVAVVGAADDDRAAGPRLQQADAAQDQRAHDALAELGLRDQQRAQPFRRDDQASTGSCAWPSTRDGRPDSCASSPMKEPGPWVMIGTRRPASSYWPMSTFPDRIIVSP